MDAKVILVWVVIGVIAGWIASFFGGSSGILVYLISGLIGSFVGGFLAHKFNMRPNLGNAFLDQIVVSTVGAIIVVIIARIIV